MSIKRRKRPIASRVEGFSTIPWAKLKEYRFNDLKEADKRDVEKLKKAIIDQGFCFPIEVWSGHDYVVDGRGRKQALLDLEAQGFDIPDLPIIEIQADSLSEAKRLVLMRASEHGVVTQDTFDAFTKDMINPESLADHVYLPGIDIGVVDTGLGDVSAPEEFDSYSSEEMESNDEDSGEIRCPRCGYRVSE